MCVCNRVLEAVAEPIVPAVSAPEQARATGVAIVQVSRVSAPRASNGLGGSRKARGFKPPPSLCINRPQQRTAHAPAVPARRRRVGKCGDDSVLCAPRTRRIQVQVERRHSCAAPQTGDGAVCTVVEKPHKATGRRDPKHVGPAAKIGISRVRSTHTSTGGFRLCSCADLALAWCGLEAR
jgi:hypothetical protein